MLSLRRNFAPRRMRRNFGLADFDRMFDRFFEDSDEFAMRPFAEFSRSFNPTLDVSESDNEIKVSAELPGLNEDDIDVSLTGDVLTISGEKKAETEDKGENYHRIERTYGSFKRTITLPSEVEVDQVEANFKNGVLTIILPKRAEAQENVKKIDVKAS